MHNHTRKLIGQSLVVICLIAAVAAGCKPSGTNDAKPVVNIAICDMDKVAAEMGYMQNVRARLTEGNTQLVEQLQAEKTKLSEVLNAKEKEFGEEATDEQKQELAQLVAHANQKMQNLKVEADARLNRFRALLLQETRSKVAQPISEVAKQQGIQIVASKHAAFVFVDDAADITDAVIAAAKKAAASSGDAKSDSGGDSGGESGGESGGDSSEQN